jgi:hypothetical protein
MDTVPVCSETSHSLASLLTLSGFPTNPLELSGGGEPSLLGWLCSVRRIPHRQIRNDIQLYHDHRSASESTPLFLTSSPPRPRVWRSSLW